MSTFRSLATALGIAASTTSCTHLFYQPSDVLYARHPEQLDSLRTEIQLTSSDGTHLAAWWLKARRGPHRGTVLQFHGNGENMTSHFASMLWLLDEGYDVMTFDYRGYGISEGKPSQEGLNLDAQAAIRFALSRIPAASQPELILYGQSLGGAVVARAYDDITREERQRVRAMVIESSFYSYKKIAANMLSRSWISFLFQPLAYILVSNSTSPEDSIPRISPTPLLVLHGDRDPVIPLQFGRKIFELAREPKRFFLIPGGEHLWANPESTQLAHREILGFLSDPPRIPLR